MAKHIVRPLTPLPPPYERAEPVPSHLENVKSVGIKTLSKPLRPRKFYNRGDNAPIVFTVSKAAQKYITSARMKVISKPKPNLEKPPKEDPYKVSPNALTGKIKPKSLEYLKKLAKPIIRQKDPDKRDKK